MSNVKVRYLDGAVDIDSVTTTDFSTLFDGGELVIAGRLADTDVSNVISQVSVLVKRIDAMALYGYCIIYILKHIAAI